ncbi:MAG: hypothetical protein K0S04_3485 [Herbinix sp.]|jgi:hypothetical protein|nr:hypothetical protein [Herbinix sp.]
MISQIISCIIGQMCYDNRGIACNLSVLNVWSV